MIYNMSTEVKEILNSIWNELGMIYKLLEENFKKIAKLLKDIETNTR